MTEPSRLGGVLEAGETVIWTGRPHDVLFLSRRQGAALAFNLVWWLIMLLIGAAAWSMRGSPIVIVLAIVALIGVLQDSWRTGGWLMRRIGEHYVLTDRRVLVIERNGQVRAAVGLLSSHQFRPAPASGPRGSILLGADQPLWSPTSKRSLKLNPDEDAPRLSGLVGHVAVLALIHKTAADYEARWVASADAPSD